MAHIILQEALDIKRISQLHAEIAKHIGEQEVSINASGVHKITTPAVQLLIAFCRGVESAGGHARITAPSEEFITAFSDLGLTSELQLRVSAHG